MSENGVKFQNGNSNRENDRKVIKQWILRVPPLSKKNILMNIGAEEARKLYFMQHVVS
jgi:hypothetical protein